MPLSMTLQPAQKLQLNARLVQQMKLLQMNGQELENYLAKAVEENPVLEFPEETAGSSWQEEGPDFRRIQRKETAPDDDPLPNPVENAHQKDMTLEEALEEQLGCLHLEEKERRFAYYIVATLDAGGYWKENLEKTAQVFGLSPEEAAGILSRVQHLEPVGVAARSLTECLLLQMEPETAENRLARTIVKDGLELLAANKIPVLAAQFHVSANEVLAAKRQIRGLNPKPGAAYRQNGPVLFLHEDAFVETRPEGLKVTVYNPWGGRLVLDQAYLSIADTTDNPKIRTYLKNQIGRARQLQQLIKGRSDTLQFVLQALVTHQENFFRYGPGHKAPLKLADLAEETGFAVSTVSRALQNKMIACRWGSFPARDFLVGTAESVPPEGEPCTEEQLAARIRRIIDKEDKKHPLSDQAICDRLQEEGTRVARRTVNKYRVKMGIPDKSSRKDWS